jgi:hypothetical protein
MGIALVAVTKKLVNSDISARILKAAAKRELTLRTYVRSDVGCINCS